MKRLLLFAALIAWSGMAGAVVYKWVDAQGKVLYGDRPPDGVHAEVVEMLGNHVARATSTKDASPSSRSGGKNDSAQDDASTKKAVDNDVQQVKEQQCAAAQEQYKKLIEGRRIYKTGADGERQYLTAEEIDTQRADAKREVDATCNSAT
jgi:flagellar hook-length control protein FliK